MIKATAINGPAVLVGLLDRFEIWNPERYEAVSKADEFMSQDAFTKMESAYEHAALTYRRKKLSRLA